MAGKRKSNDGSDAPENEVARAPKASRIALNPEETTGQRFGETVDFIPLPPLSQVFAFDQDDDQAADVVQGSQEVDDYSLTTYILYGMHSSSDLCRDVSSQAPCLTSLTGIVSTQIVGVRFYRGRANPQERVIIHRDVHNQYDRNAIRVDNVMGAQIGHIPRQIAAKLAPYMVCISNMMLLRCF